MKKTIVALLLIEFLASPISAHITDSSSTLQRIATLEGQCRDLRRQNEALQRELVRIDQRCLVFSAKTDSNSRAIKQLADNLNGQLTETNAAIDENVAKVNKGVKSRTVLGIVIAVVLVLLTAGVFLLLRRRIAKKGDDIDLLRSRTDDLNRQLSKKGDDIELLRARADDLNRQMVEKMDKEIEELQKISERLSTPQNAQTTSEPDHSLVKALADRITFMEMTLYRMDSSVKGHKHLTKSIKQMKDNLFANGYELVDMLGKEYVEGMKATSNFVEDENIEEGKRIITGIIKPQINYKGKMIQTAQLTVSQNI